LKHALGINTAFHVRRVLGTPRLVDTGEPVDARADEAVLAVAGIARPDRFFADLAAVGWRIAGTRTFRDHHPFTDDDVDRMARAARDVSAGLVLTTEKDGVRLAALALRPSKGGHVKGLRLAAVPLTVVIEPPAFAGWLLARVHAKHPPSLAGATELRRTGPPRV
jgi:tetraacyldisaccharide 4'-kinase